MSEQMKCTLCKLCKTPMGSEESVNSQEPMHWECVLRAVMGGIGHLLDHEHFCLSKNDPDAGLDYRTSAALASVLLTSLYVRGDLEPQ